MELHVDLSDWLLRVLSGSQVVKWELLISSSNVLLNKQILVSSTGHAFWSFALQKDDVLGFTSLRNPCKSL